MQISRIEAYPQVASASKAERGADTTAHGWSDMLAAAMVKDSQSLSQPIAHLNETPANAEKKLTELMMAQALREILPNFSGGERTLASDTWRGLFADIVAEEVAAVMPAIVDIKNHEGA